MRNNIKVLNFSQVKINDEMYGGQGGKKFGFYDKNGNAWFLKLPQNITGQKGVLNDGAVYSNSTISEYIGSQIYQEMGFPVHKTLLGIYRDKIVCVCKDFKEEGQSLFEINKLLNNTISSLEIEKELEKVKSPANEIQKKIDLGELLVLLKNGTFPISNYKLQERFWDMFVIDSFISNQDRHNENWGVLKSKKGDINLAPIFDNGACFFPKTPDEKLTVENLEKFYTVGDTPYSYKGKGVNSRLAIENLYLDKQTKQIEWGLVFSIIKNVPKIKESIEELKDIIKKIPREVNQMECLNDVRKDFYTSILDLRLEKVLNPSYEKASEIILENIEKNKLKGNKDFIFSVPEISKIQDEELREKLLDFLDNNFENINEMIIEKTLKDTCININKYYPKGLSEKETINIVERQIEETIDGMLKDKYDYVAIKEFIDIVNEELIEKLREEKYIFSNEEDKKNSLEINIENTLEEVDNSNYEVSKEVNNNQDNDIEI